MSKDVKKPGGCDRNVPVAACSKAVEHASFLTHSRLGPGQALVAITNRLLKNFGVISYPKPQ